MNKNSIIKHDEQAHTEEKKNEISNRHKLIRNNSDCMDYIELFRGNKPDSKYAIREDS